MNIFAGNRPFLERGNNSFRFKNSSAYEPEKAKEKNRNFTTASDPKHSQRAGQISAEITDQFLVEINKTIFC